MTVRTRTAVGYVRVSTRGQRLNSSFGRQAEAIEAWCSKHNVELLSITCEVASGGIPWDVRPGARECDALHRAKNADYIVCESVDRYTRAGSKDVPGRTVQFVDEEGDRVRRFGEDVVDILGTYFNERCEQLLGPRPSGHSLGWVPR